MMRRIAAAGAALSLPVGLAGCGGDEPAEQASEATTTTSQVPLPNVDELAWVVDRLANPDTPAEERADYIEGSDIDAAALEALGDEIAEQDVRFEVTGPVEHGEDPQVAVVDITIHVGEDETQRAEAVQFVRDDNGDWKLAASWACAWLIDLAPEGEAPEACSK